MTRKELARLIDHSVLHPEATEEEIRAGTDIVRTWAIAFYCVQPCWVRIAAQALAGTDAHVVSVVGFPHGCDRAEVFEALPPHEGVEEFQFAGLIEHISNRTAEKISHKGTKVTKKS